MKLGHSILLGLVLWCVWDWLSATSAIATMALTVICLVSVAILNGYFTYATLRHKFPPLEYRDTRRNQQIGLIQFSCMVGGIVALIWFTPLYFSWIGLVLGIVPGCTMSSGQDRLFKSALVDRLAELDAL